MKNRQFRYLTFLANDTDNQEKVMTNTFLMNLNEPKTVSCTSYYFLN